MNELDKPLGFDEFMGRVVGLIAVSGVGPLAGLRNVCRALHAWVVPEQALVPRAWDAFDESGRPKTTGLENRLRTVGTQVARFAYLHCSSKAREFMSEWERAFPNPGGEGR
jgi:NAD(P)H-dependent FMN reductase